MPEKSIFQLLNLPENSSEETIKTSFREFAKKNHPDFFPSDKAKEERFKIVALTYEKYKHQMNILRQIRRLRKTIATNPFLKAYLSLSHNPKKEAEKIGFYCQA